MSSFYWVTITHFRCQTTNLPLSKICQASAEKQSHTFSVKQPTFLCQKYVKLLLRNNHTLLLSNNQPSFVKNMSSFYWETITHFCCQTTNLPLSKICQASTEKQSHTFAVKQPTFLCQKYIKLLMRNNHTLLLSNNQPSFAKICQASTEKQSHTFSVKQSNLPLSKICQASTEKQSHTFSVKQSNLPLSKICQASTEKQSHTFSVKQPTFLCQKYVKLLLRNSSTHSLSNNQPSFVKNISSFYWESIPHFRCQTTNLPLSKIYQASTEKQSHTFSVKQPTFLCQNMLLFYCEKITTLSSVVKIYQPSTGKRSQDFSVNKQFNLPWQNMATFYCGKISTFLCKTIQPSFVKICLHSTVKSSPHSL